MSTRKKCRICDALRLERDSLAYRVDELLRQIAEREETISRQAVELENLAELKRQLGSATSREAAMLAEVIQLRAMQVNVVKAIGFEVKQ